MELVEEWFNKHDLMKYVSDITCEKPRAQYYIDDKAVEFLSWNQTLIKLGEIPDPRTKLDKDMWF